MSLTRYNPTNLFDQWHRDFNQLLRPFKKSDMFNENTLADSDFMPAVDIEETENSYLIKADIPGIEPDNITITASNGVLTIKGERESETESKKGDLHYTERSYGSFVRQFNLPSNVNESDIHAKTHHGVITIDLPKSEPSQPHKITIKKS